MRYRGHGPPGLLIIKEFLETGVVPVKISSFKVSKISESTVRTVVVAKVSVLVTVSPIATVLSKCW